MFPDSNGNMIKMNFNVGPTQLYPGVAEDIADALKTGICSISHRSPRFSELYAKARKEIFTYFNLPSDWQIYFLGTGSEAMEAACRGLIRKQSEHHVNGSFSRRAYDFAGMIKRTPILNEKTDFNGWSGEPSKAPAGTDCAFFTKTETATGVSVSWDYIRAYRERNPDVTIVCDCVSVVPTEPLDALLCDYYFFGVQKGCGLPAGLGVALVSPRAIEKTHQMAKDGIDVGANRSIVTMHKYAVKDQTLDTPPVLHIYLLGRAFERFNKITLKKMEADTIAKADQLYDWLESSDLYYPAVKDKALRARTAVAVSFREGVTEEAVLSATRQAGFETGLGYGKHRGTMIRISNFPAHELSDHKELINALESVKVDRPVRA